MTQPAPQRIDPPEPSATPVVTTPSDAKAPPDASSGPVLMPPTTPAAHHELYRPSFARWFGLGIVRLIYRQWTRVAAKSFPEGSRQAKFIERLGIPLPDRLDLSWVDDTLAVGGRIRPADIPKLQRAGVTRVVDVRAEHRDDESALKANGIQLLYLPTPDTYPLSLDDLRRGAEWINMQRRAGERVLIHCEHGVGRSVLLTAAALVCEGMAPKDAFQCIEDCRWQAAPNHRQVVRLIEFARAGACKGA